MGACGNHFFYLLLIITAASAQCTTDNHDTCDTQMNNECKRILKHFTAIIEIVGPDFACNAPINFINETTELLLSEQDPFLLLHEFGPRDWKIGENKGVPLHPHAGFESVTYIKTGESKHSDSLGNEGILYSGDCQWLTAGKGIIHSESTQHPGGIQHGFQFWINLQNKYKYGLPKYQYLSNKKFPSFNVEGYNNNVKIKLIVGNYYDKINDKMYISPINTAANVYILDINIINNQEFIYNIPSNNLLNTFIVYVYEGLGSFYNDNDWIDVERKSTLYFDGLNGNCIQTKSIKSTSFGFLLLIGEPIKQEIFGDNMDLDKGFIMNTQREVNDFVQKYLNGTLRV